MTYKLQDNALIKAHTIEDERLKTKLCNIMLI